MFTSKPFWWSNPPSVLRFTVAIISVGLALLLAQAIEHLWHSSPQVSLFLCAIIFSAWFGGFRAGLAAVALAALAFDYFFLAQSHSLAMDPNEIPRLVLFVISALLVCLLSAAQRRTAVSLSQARDNLAAKFHELNKTNEALQVENAERKRAEGALWRSEGYLSEAQRLSRTGSFGWSVSTGDIFWSDETFQIFQYDRATKPTVELILKRVHPDDAALVKVTIERASQAGADFDFEHRLLMPDGSVKHLHVVAHAERDESNELEFVGAVMDVTVAKEAEDKIRLIINTVPGLLWTARPDGWVDFLNERWLDYTGMTLEQGLGWAWQPGYHPDDLGNVLSKWRAAVAERKPLEVEARLRRFDGEYRWFLKRAFPLFDHAGRVLGWYGGNIDIHDLKQAEEKLRKSETYLSEGQRLSHTGSWAWSVKTKENLFWSREHYRIYGFDPDTDSGQYGAARERIHPVDLRIFDEKLERAIQDKGDFEIDYRIVLPGGEVKHIHNIGHPQLNNAGELVEFIGTTMDVTERKQAEEALRRSENYLAEAQRLSHTGSWARSPATGETGYWSEECRRLMGYEPQDAPPSFETYLQRVHPDDQARVREIVETAGREKVDYQLDYRLIHPGGEIRDIHTTGHPVFGPSGDLVEYVGTVIDITEQKRAEKALQASERELRLIAESIPGMIVVSTPDGATEYATQRLLDFVGKESAEMKDLKWVSVVHPEDADSMVNKWLYSVKTGQPLEVIYRMRRADGVYRWFQVRVEPLFDEQGKVLHWYGLIIDVDDQINAAEALRKSQAELAHVSRLTTMGELTASIAHEVNQPLTAVVNNANASISLLPKVAPNLEEVREALTEIIEDANRASDVIARVRQLAKRAAVEKSLLDLRDLVQDVLVLARYESATRHIVIRADLSTDLPAVSGDRVQLQQVLLNLIMNGMDAMNQVEEAQRVLVIGGRCEMRDGFAGALLSVQDAGIGFRAEDTLRLFEAFYTTKPHGMGMGLAISRSIIEAHGGRLWAEPNAGPGATFLFSLPGAGTPNE